MLARMNRVTIGVAVLGASLLVWGCRSSGQSQRQRSGPVAKASSASSGGARTSSTTVKQPAALERMEQFLIQGEWTGFVRSSDGLIVRRESRACPGKLPRTDKTCRPRYRRAGACTKDAQCTARVYGFCEHLYDGSSTCECHYGCMQDSDCATGQVCLCAEPAGTCVDNTCPPERCRDGKQCATYFDGCRYQAFSCLAEAPQASCVR
jgi:hypothetical protein